LLFKVWQFFQDGIVNAPIATKHFSFARNFYQTKTGANLRRIASRSWCAPKRQSVGVFGA
jgi:hypothetical protein